MAKIEEIEEETEDEKEIVVKWANYYSSFHSILLVGEGDFSFSLCLANAFGSASNMVATSLDSHDVVLQKYNNAKSNLAELKELGAEILHEVDATKMKHHPHLNNKRFDRIIFNFPHAGFKGREDSMRMINQHRHLLRYFFSNASRMIRPHGEVHVNHKIGYPFHKWNLEELAHKSSLCQSQCANFNIEDYPGYNNKRGDGSRCDQPFPLGECRTFMFRIGNARKWMMNKQEAGPSFRTMVLNHNHPESVQTTHLALVGYHPAEGWAGTNPMLLSNIEGIPSRRHYSPRLGISNVHVYQSIAGPQWNSYLKPRNELSYFTQLREIDRERVARQACEQNLIFYYK